MGRVKGKENEAILGRKKKFFSQRDQGWDVADLSESEQVARVGRRYWSSEISRS